MQKIHWVNLFRLNLLKSREMIERHWICPQPGPYKKMWRRLSIENDFHAQLGVMMKIHSRFIARPLNHFNLVFKFYRTTMNRFNAQDSTNSSFWHVTCLMPRPWPIRAWAERVVMSLSHTPRRGVISRSQPALPCLMWQSTIFGVPRYLRKHMKFEFCLRATRFAIIGVAKYHFWCHQSVKFNWRTCMWQEVAMAEANISLDWIWNLLKTDGRYMFRWIDDHNGDNKGLVLRTCSFFLSVLTSRRRNYGSTWRKTHHR